MAIVVVVMIFLLMHPRVLSPSLLFSFAPSAPLQIHELTYTTHYHTSRVVRVALKESRRVNIQLRPPASVRTIAHKCDACLAVHEIASWPWRPRAREKALPLQCRQLLCLRKTPISHVIAYVCRFVGALSHSNDDTQSLMHANIYIYELA